MTIAIIGPGAVGGAFAGALIQAGHALVFATRTPFETLDVTTAHGVVHAPAHCLLDPLQATQTPIVLLATKAHQTAAAAPWLRALCGPATVLAVLQNGIEQRETVAPCLPEGVEVVPAVVDCPADRTAPGRIIARSRVRLLLPAGAASERLVALFANTYADVSIAPDFAVAAWTKLLLNAAAGGIGVIERRGNEVLRESAHAAHFLALGNEIVAVARAEGVLLDPALPQRLLAVLQKAENARLSSIVADRLAGQPTEWRVRNEVIERIAARHSIAVPANRALTAAIRAGEPSESA
jgi:2-dehydropantoate 2-reductase